MSPAVAATCAKIEYRHPTHPAIASTCARIEYRHPGLLRAVATAAERLPE
jgi:hypothetical protein